MLKRLSCLLTISQGQFFKTRNFQTDHMYSVSHVPFNLFDEVVVVCLDPDISSLYLSFVSELSCQLRVPLTLSGRIQNLDDAKTLFDIGADRIILNTALWDNPKIVPDLAEIYGSQAILGSIDIVETATGSLSAYDWNTKSLRSSLLPPAFSYLMHSLGELIVQDVGRDGRVVGPSATTLSSFISDLNTDLPIHIGSTGLTSWNHYITMFSLDYVDAVAVSNIHHMSEDALRALRSSCKISKISVRDL